MRRRPTLVCAFWEQAELSTITISIFAASKAHDSVQIITSPFEEITA
jgi:hypothetical protein